MEERGVLEDNTVIVRLWGSNSTLWWSDQTGGAALAGTVHTGD